MDAEMLKEFDEIAAEAGEALWQGEVVLAGATYEAAVVPPREDAVLGMAGDEPGEVERVVRIRKVICTARPARHAEVVWNERKWKVRTVKGGLGDAVWTLVCEPNA